MLSLAFFFVPSTSPGGGEPPWEPYFSLTAPHGRLNVSLTSSVRCSSISSPLAHLLPIPLPTHDLTVYDVIPTFRDVLQDCTARP